MKYKNIEFVCAGNNDRSPVAEASGRRVVESRTSLPVKISSSGAGADFSQIPDLAEFLSPLVAKSVSTGYLTPDYIERAREEPEAVLDVMLAKGESWRNQYIAENIGLDFSGHKRRQTIMRPEAQLILPVDEAVLEKVLNIYRGVEGVRIELLPEYAGMSYDLSGKGANLASYQGYKEFMVKVDDAAKRAVQKALKD